MTTRDVLDSLRARWYLTALGLVLTAVACWRTVPETVFWTTTPVSVVIPTDHRDARSLADEGPAAVAAAGLLMTVVDGGHVVPQSSSWTTTLYGEGYRDATQVRLRDLGSQWSSQVPNPVIDIQVVSPREDLVAARVDDQYALLSGRLTALQDQLHVAPSQRLVLQRSPLPPTVVTVGGSRVRAIGATLALGLVLTAGLVLSTDRLLRRRIPLARRRAGLA